MAPWTVDNLPDLHGKTAIITGANSGTGFCTARALSRAGARVVMACRDPQRGEQALGRLRAEHPGGEAELASLDLANLESIERFAEAALRDYKRIDILVNNAGVMSLPKRMVTAQDFEMQLGTNHLGHFALTCRLLPTLLRTEKARVVTVSSIMHKFGDIHFGDLQAQRSYAPQRAYCQSKLANLLFTLELERRLRRTSYGLISVGAHPGIAMTQLVQNGPGLGRPMVARFASWSTSLIAQSDTAGALPIIYAAAAAEVEGGGYYGPSGFFETRGPPTRVHASGRAHDLELGQRLWAVSEELTGLRAADLVQKAS